MTGPFSVDTDQLEHIVAQLANLAGLMTDHLDDLQRKVDAVHSGSWAGTAATAYRDAHDQWASAVTELIAGVTEMSTAADTAKDGYHGAAGTNTSMLRGGS